MVQVIGLIVVLYAFVRLLQAPFLMVSDRRDEFTKLPFHLRFYIVALTSVAGLIGLLMLALLLLASSHI